MVHADCRPVGRLCYWALLVVMSAGARLPVCGANPQGGLTTTTVADTVYLADGTPASGSVIITWPAFVTAGGAGVAAGNTSVTLGANGALSVALVSNAGATPAESYYTAVYQLGPGQVRTEYWIVPTNSPANLAAVRITAGAGVAGQAVSMQYLNSELATKANDSAVVHASGDETISGTKTFASAPNVPAPTSAGQVASKAYVDQAVSNVGAGNYLPTAGGTMTGPILLPGNPASALQATPKQYVDTGLSGKADLIAGLVPAGELGAGQASASNCLLGNGTWGPCAAGGTGNVSTTPAANQTIAQPVGTQFAVNNLANIRYVTANWNWSQQASDSLATPGSNTIHLTPCPAGIDTASASNYYTYRIYVSGTGTAEAAPVTGGTCTSGAASGTMVVTTANPHASGYTVGSASSGIQEAWNDAWVADNGGNGGAAVSTAPYVKLAADTNYNIYSSVYLRGRGGVLDGTGALIVCSTRDRCIYIGTTQGTPQVNHHKLYDLTGVSTLNVDGVQVASVAAASGLYTVSMTSTHPFVAGDVVDCEWYSQNTSQHFASTVLASGLGATQFQMQYGSTTFAAGANTFGFCGLLNAFIEDNSDHAAIQDINVVQVSGTGGGLGQFSYGIVDDNDQQLIVERASNRSQGSIRSDASFPMGAFLYQRTDQGDAGIPYVHDSEFTNVNCIQAGGNGLVFSDSVCQGFPVYGVRYFGGYQPATFSNIYQESTGSTTNPLYSAAAQMGYLVSGGNGTKFVGTFPVSGYEPAFATGGTGATERDYWVVPRSSTMGYGPVLFAGYAQPANSSTNITITWPSIELQDGNFHQSLGTLTWDILVTVGQSGNAPYGTGTYALATNAAVSCGTNGMCSFVDTQPAATSYTVQGQQFTPVFWFWPVNVAINGGPIFADVVGTDPQAVSSLGTKGVSIVAEQCTPGGAWWKRTPIWVSCLANPSSYGSGSSATVLQQQDVANNGPAANSKGRLNFGKPIGNMPNDMITLADSNFAKTVATAGQRPSNDAGDIAIGEDVYATGMSLRAGGSISSYINTTPNPGATNFLERLTVSGKTFNVPVTASNGLAVSGGTVTLPVTGTGSQCLHVNAQGVVSGTGSDCGSGSTGSVTVDGGTNSQLAMYSGNGMTVGGDSVLTDDGATLTYAGAGGIGTTKGAFSGNLTVNGQLEVAGPWAVSSPIPGTPMGAAGAGTSSLGISNDGNLYVSNNGGTPEKVATSATSSYFPYLVQEDANDLSEYNGLTPQGFRVYGTYTDASNFERTGLGWDQTDGYFVLRNENAGTGQQRGIGFWIGSGVRWGIDTTSVFKPFQNNSFDIGVPTTGAQFVPRTIYAGTSFDTLTQGRLNFELCNDATTGTMLNFLAKYDGQNPACAVRAGATDTDGVIGVVSNGSGTSGNAIITYRGYAACSFDGSTTAGDYVVASTNATYPGDCHDAGTARPTGVQVLGRVESTNTGAGTYGVRVSLDAPVGSGGSLNSPTFTGTATAPTFNATSGLEVNGSALASTNLSDGANLPNLLGKTWASPGAIGSTTPGAGTFTTVTATGGSFAANDPYFDVTSPTYGVVANNSSVDYSTNFQNAINAAEAANATLRIPPGQYWVHGLKITNNLHVVCEGSASWNGNDTAVLETKSADAVLVIGSINNGSVNQQGPDIENCTFQDASGSGAMQDGIVIANTNNVHLRRVSIENLNANANEGAPANPSASGGVTGTTYYYYVTCISDYMNQTIHPAESSFAGTGSAGNPLTISAPTCGTNMTGWIAYVGTSTGSETKQTSNSGAACTRNTSQTGCALTSSWFGTPTSSGINAPELDHSGANGILVTSHAGIDVQTADASYIDIDQPFIRNVQNGITLESGFVAVHGAGHLTCGDGTHPGTCINNEGGASEIADLSLEPNSNSTSIYDSGHGLGMSGTGATMTRIHDVKFEGNTGCSSCVHVVHNKGMLALSNSQFNKGTTGVSVTSGISYASILGTAFTSVATSCTDSNPGDVTIGCTQGGITAGSLSVTGTTTLGAASGVTPSAGDNSQKLATTAYVKNEMQLAWTCPVAGATTSGVSYCNWTAPANLTVTQFDLAASTAPGGCTTYPTLQVWDGKANAEVGSYSISMTSGNNFYNAVTVGGGVNLAAGEYLRIKVTTGGSGCGTNPAGIVATVTYQMQN